MGKWRAIIKKMLFLAATGSSTLLVACAYGVPFGYGGYWGYWLVKTRRADNVPVSGLRLVVINPTGSTPDTLYETKTVYGEEMIEFPDSTMDGSGKVAVLVQDVDDTAHGGAFADTLLLKPDGEDTTTLILRERP